MPLQDITQDIIVNPIARKPRDWSALARTVDKMETRHYKALEQAGAIQKYLGSLDLNEKEQPWLTEYSGQINNAINATVDENIGYYGNALSDAIKMTAKVSNDPALRGRLNEQAKYKAWKDSIEKGVLTGQWSRDVADMFIEQNPYNYVDKYKGETDGQALTRASKSNGVIPSTGGQQSEIVGGVGGNYGNPTKTVDINAIWDKTFANLRPVGTTSNTIYYVDETGNYTTDASKSANGLPYYKTTQGYQGVTKERIAAAFRQAVEATPGAEASLRQQLETGIWKADKDNSIDKTKSPFFDEGGLALNYNQYLNSLIDPAARVLAWSTTSNDYNPLLGMQLDSAILRKKGTTGISDAITRTSDMNTLGKYYDRTVEGELYHINVKGKMGGYIKNYAKKRGISVGDNETIETIYRKIQNPTQDVIDAYRAYKDSEVYLAANGAASATDADIRAAYEMRMAIDNGYFPEDKNNKYYKTYQTYINDAFMKDGVSLDALYFKIPEQDIKSEFGVENIREIGLESEDRFIKLTKANRSLLPKLITLAEKALPKLIPVFPGMSPLRSETSIIYIKTDGNYKAFDTGSYTAIKRFDDELQNVIDKYNEMTVVAKEYAGNYTQHAQRQAVIMPFADLITKQAYNSGQKEQELKNLDELTKNTINAHNPTNDKYFYFTDENGVMQHVDAGDKAREDIWQLLKDLPQDRITNYVTNTGDWYIEVAGDASRDYSSNKSYKLPETIKKHNKELNLNSGFTIMVPGSINSGLREAFENNPHFSGKLMTYNAIDAEMPNIPLFPSIIVSPVTSSTNQNDVKGYNVKFDNNASLTLSSDKGEYLLGVRNIILNLIDAYNNNQIDNNACVNRIDSLLAPIFAESNGDVDISNLGILRNTILTAIENY